MKVLVEIDLGPVQVSDSENFEELFQGEDQKISIEARMLNEDPDAEGFFLFKCMGVLEP